MAALDTDREPRLRLNYGQKIALLAALPLILSAAAIAVLVAGQSRQMAEREIRALETRLIEAKKEELRNYVTQARNGFFFLYAPADVDDEEAKLQVLQILAAMTYGDEGFFFVYDYDGTNLVSPRQTDLINRNWWDLQDSEGTYVVREFIEAARSGSFYVDHLWPKPSTGEEARMISYVVSFPTWRWAMGTGVFIDDIVAGVEASRAEVQARVQRTFLYIGAITLAALLLVFVSGLYLNLRERRLADTKLKALTQRIIDTQEEERGRVARELHDSISQILVSVRYALELARRRLAKGDVRTGESLDKGIDTLGGAIQEVRRISRDLRPGVLDDLGLGPALQSLTDDFQTRTGIETDFETVVFRNRLDREARIALYRVAQEALTNIDRHAGATRVTMSIRGHRTGALLRVTDNGKGLPQRRSHSGPGGLGLRNMTERMEQLGGSLRLLSTTTGLTVEAQVPLTHMLPPERGSTKESA